MGFFFSILFYVNAILSLFCSSLSYFYYYYQVSITSLSLILCSLCVLFMWSTWCISFLCCKALWAAFLGWKLLCKQRLVLLVILYWDTAEFISKRVTMGINNHVCIHWVYMTINCRVHSPYTVYITNAQHLLQYLQYPSRLCPLKFGYGELFGQVCTQSRHKNCSTVLAARYSQNLYLQLIEEREQRSPQTLQKLVKTYSTCCVTAYSYILSDWCLELVYGCEEFGLYIFGMEHAHQPLITIRKKNLNDMPLCVWAMMMVPLQRDSYNTSLINLLF